MLNDELIRERYRQWVELRHMGVAALDIAADFPFAAQFEEEYQSELNQVKKHENINH